MDWNIFAQIAWRTALKFGATYLAARGSGATNWAGLAAAGTAVLAGESKGVNETLKS